MPCFARNVIFPFLNFVLFCYAANVPYAGAVAGRGSYTETIWPFHIIDLNCTGIEVTVWECPHNDLFETYSCASRSDASVRCRGICTINH